MREILTHGSARGSNQQHPRNTHPKAQKQKCGHGATVESKDCGLALYSTNVSFRPSFALTNRYFRAIKSINFDGARMDKLTFASLKGMGAELSKVEVI